MKSQHAAALVVAMLVAIPAIAAAESEPASASETAGDLIDEQQAVDREYRQRLRRARERHEANRTEAARRRGADQNRQAEIHRLHLDTLKFERRESALHHDARQSQQELHLIPRGTADHAAIAKRSELERQLHDQQLQLHRTTTSRDDAMKRLDQFRLR